MFMLCSVILNEHDSLLRNGWYAIEHKNDIDKTVLNWNFRLSLVTISSAITTYFKDVRSYW